MEALDPLPLSALQHWSYCPRQCALIHQEQSFAENVFTQRGQAAHSRVDVPGFATIQGVRAVRALPLYCDRLGLIGKADVVEFLEDGTPYPVEYKHGPRREREHDDLQLGAQALCLEEMTGRHVGEGSIYHFSSRSRRIVKIGEALRVRVESAVLAVRQILESGRLPSPTHDQRCRNCSLSELCQPEVVSNRSRLEVLGRQLFEVD